MRTTEIYVEAPTKLEQIVALTVGAVWAFFVLSLIVFLRPYWALMDDHGHLWNKPFMVELGFVKWMSQFIRDDSGWGMFRTVYGAYIYFFYGLLGHSNFAAYMVLFMVNICIFFIWGLGFVECLDATKQEHWSAKATVWCALFVILCFHFI